jgi:hypothetical protein
MVQLAKDELERVVGFASWLFDGMHAERGDTTWSTAWTALGFCVFVPESTASGESPENRLSLRYTFRHDASGALTEFRVFGDTIDALRQGEDHLASDWGPEMQFYFWEALETDTQARLAGEHWVNADLP